MNSLLGTTERKNSVLKVSHHPQKSNGSSLTQRYIHVSHGNHKILNTVINNEMQSHCVGEMFKCHVLPYFTQFAPVGDKRYVTLLF